MAQRIGLGSARVSRAGKRVLAIADFPCEYSFFAAEEIQGKDCFGATPKPTHATRALPKRAIRASSPFLHHKNERTNQCRGKKNPDAL